MKRFAYGLVAVALAAGFSAFTTPSAKKDTQFWVYTSPTNQDFQIAAKYEIQTLSSPDAADCNDVPERPCVLEEATSSDTTQLHTQLQGMTDQQIVDVSLRRQSDQ